MTFKVLPPTIINPSCMLEPLSIAAKEFQSTGQRRRPNGANFTGAPAVDQLAVEYLGYRPDQILMVACHKYDLRAAKAFGMHTAFVARPLVFGPDARPDITPANWIDCCVDSFTSLADQLGAA